MIFLKNDYSLGAHPKVLNALVETNMIQTEPYGLDEYCAAAAQRIRNLIDCQNADVHFLTGGTQVNLTAISAFLRPHHSVIAPENGHICVHETGAIEATGHKVNHVITMDGRLRPADLRAVVANHSDEHFVKPRLVYISNTSEMGLIYSRQELAALRKACDELGLLLYMDGARLAMALSYPGADLTFEDLPKYLDAFYIGGTKCGALFGEALVIVNDTLKEDMRHLIKQRGAMLAKGRLLGVQFDALLKDNLYLELGAAANAAAQKLIDGLKAKGYRFTLPPKTNQIFVLIPNEKMPMLEENVCFERWTGSTETHAAIRLVTSWATTEAEIEEFLALL